jgi:hypothetical protein
VVMATQWLVVYMVMAWGREGGVHLRPAELFVLLNSDLVGGEIL